MGDSRTLDAETPAKDLLAPPCWTAEVGMSRASRSPEVAAAPRSEWPEGRGGCVPFSRWTVLDFSAEYAVIMNSFLSIHVLG